MMKFFLIFLQIVTIEAAFNQSILTSTITDSKSTTASSVSTTLEQKSMKKIEWYGKESDVDDVIGCKWPQDFEARYKFCANRTGIEMTFGNKTQYGLFDQMIVDRLMEKCKNGQCADAKINRTDFLSRGELWLDHVQNISDFGKCLKKNTEGMVHLCSSNDQVSQTVAGFAGLHLSVIELLNGAQKKLGEHGNHTETCLIKLSEAIHFTGALYMDSQFYSQNKVLCWDLNRGTCSPICKQFAYILTCLKSVCSTMEKDLPHYGIWEWFYADAEKAKKICDVQVNNAQCQLDAMAAIGQVTTPAPATDFNGKAKEAYKKVEKWFDDFKHSVESTFHMKFYQFAAIVGSSLAIFIALVTLLCMWYNGLICQRRKRRVLRYAKLVPEDHMGRKGDERKSLTDFDADDIE